MIIKFLLMLAIVTGLVYITVAPENKQGVILLAMVIALLVVGFRPLTQTAGAADPEVKVKEVKASHDVLEPKDVKHVQAKVLEEPSLPQVDVLGRNIDDKMALNKTSSQVIAPGGVNDVFEARVKEDKHNQIAGYEGNDIGALL